MLPRYPQPRNSPNGPEPRFSWERRSWPKHVGMCHRQSKRMEFLFSLPAFHFGTLVVLWGMGTRPPPPLPGCFQGQPLFFRANTPPLSVEAWHHNYPGLGCWGSGGDGLGSTSGAAGVVLPGLRFDDSTGEWGEGIARRKRPAVTRMAEATYSFAYMNICSLRNLSLLEIHCPENTSNHKV